MYTRTCVFWTRFSLYILAVSNHYAAACSVYLLFSLAAVCVCVCKCSCVCVVCVGKHCSRGKAGSKHVRGTRARVYSQRIICIIIYFCAAAAASATDVSGPLAVTDSGAR